MFQSHHYENVSLVNSSAASHKVRNVRMETRPECLPQSGADTQRAKICLGTGGGHTNSQAYENVRVTQAAGSQPRHPEEDPFEGFEEAIKNSEVISIKKVRLIIVYGDSR